MNTELRALLERHRPGIGARPWVKYCDLGFDARTMSYYNVNLRGYGWSKGFHIGGGPLVDQVSAWLIDHDGQIDPCSSAETSAEVCPTCQGARDVRNMLPREGVIRPCQSVWHTLPPL